MNPIVVSNYPSATLNNTLNNFSEGIEDTNSTLDTWMQGNLNKGFPASNNMNSLSGTTLNEPTRRSSQISTTNYNNNAATANWLAVSDDHINNLPSTSSSSIASPLSDQLELAASSNPLNSNSMFLINGESNYTNNLNSLMSTVDDVNNFSAPSGCSGSPHTLPAIKQEEVKTEFEDLFSQFDVMSDTNTANENSSIVTLVDENADSKSTTNSKGQPKRKRAARKRLTPHQKEAHNKIEKRYRININTKIAKLQQIIPWVAREQTAFEVSDKQKTQSTENSPNATTKLNKSMILEKAVDYILYLQNNERLYEMEVTRLKNEVESLKQQQS